MNNNNFALLHSTIQGAEGMKLLAQTFTGNKSLFATLDINEISRVPLKLKVGDGVNDYSDYEIVKIGNSTYQKEIIVHKGTNKLFNGLSMPVDGIRGIIKSSEAGGDFITYMNNDRSYAVNKSGTYFGRIPNGIPNIIGYGVGPTDVLSINGTSCTYIYGLDESFEPCVIDQYGKKTTLKGCTSIMGVVLIDKKIYYMGVIDLDTHYFDKDGISRYIQPHKRNTELYPFIKGFNMDSSDIK